VFYFADAPTLFVDLFTGEAAPVAYITVAILTATTILFGGIAREQVCIYMCPWPRIQAAMMDEDTITVAYRDWRGEPRGKHRKAEGAEALGDCIDCNACVNVCPMGIDIRDGQQLACITCALCIDACDDVMAKIGKPRGLVDYIALTDESRERAGQPPKPIWKHILRPRTILYTALWSLVGFGLVFALFIRSDISATVAPIRNPVYVTLSDGSIRNTYDVRLRNSLGEERPFRLTVTGEDSLVVELEGLTDNVVYVPANETLLQRAYVVAPAGSAPAGSGRTEIRFWIEDIVSGERVSKDTVFNGRVQ
jgi:cytochrome c oxidase accessory protein FixG